MMQIFLSILPVIWLFAAACAGLVLYKSGAAIVDWNHGDARTKKKVMLGGSTAIAAVAFFGMNYMTPKSVLTPVPVGTTNVQAEKLKFSQRLAGEVDDGTQDLITCLKVEKMGECLRRASEVGRKTAQLRGELDAMQPVSEK